VPANLPICHSSRLQFNCPSSLSFLLCLHATSKQTNKQSSSLVNRLLALVGYLLYNSTQHNNSTSYQVIISPLTCTQLITFLTLPLCCSQLVKGARHTHAILPLTRLQILLPPSPSSSVFSLPQPQEDGHRTGERIN
jgi:hypothetical protein